MPITSLKNISLGFRAITEESQFYCMVCYDNLYNNGQKGFQRLFLQIYAVKKKVLLKKYGTFYWLMLEKMLGRFSWKFAIYVHLSLCVSPPVSLKRSRRGCSNKNWKLKIILVRMIFCWTFSITKPHSKRITKPPGTQTF